MMKQSYILNHTAISWNVYRVLSVLEVVDRTVRQEAQYTAIAFVFAALAAWAHWFEGKKESLGKSVWTFLFYGLFFFVHIGANNSWRVLDDLRFAQKNHISFDGDFGNGAVHLTYNNVKKMLGANVLNYIGIYLLLAVVHGSWKIKINLSFFFFLAAVACNVIGVIILWNLDSVVHTFKPALVDDDLSASPWGGEDYVSNSARYIVFDQITVPQTAILFILAGAILHTSVDGANFAVGLTAIWGLWYLPLSSSTPCVKSCPLSPAPRCPRPGQDHCSVGHRRG